MGLYAKYPNLVHVQMGLTAADDSVRRLMEPNAACVLDRLATLAALRLAGVSCEIRMDPLIPGLKDVADACCHPLPDSSRKKNGQSNDLFSALEMKDNKLF